MENPQNYKLICSEFLATRKENINLLKLFKQTFLRSKGLPEYKIILPLSEWEREFKKFIH